MPTRIVFLFPTVLNRDQSAEHILLPFYRYRHQRSSFGLSRDFLASRHFRRGNNRR